MSFQSLLVVAGLLSLERIAYVAVWYRPRQFASWCGRWSIAGLTDPVDALEKLFGFFKVLQFGVFVAWCWFHGAGVLWPPSQQGVVFVLAGVLLAIGQSLNLIVFRRLGKVGVFYGNRFGHRVPWCEAFPFNVLKHPQYVGAVLSIWGFFLAMRFPQQDWYVLPALETFYYVVGAYLEAHVHGGFPCEWPS